MVRSGIFGPAQDWPAQDLIAFSAEFGPALVLDAYRSGVFPMPLHASGFGEMGWWSPTRRGVLPLDALRVTRSMRQSARRYTTMHPGTKEAALAHHIIVSSYFDEMVGPNRDQSNARKALAELKTLKARYPDSPYARDADNRMRIAEDNIAASEMEVGRYYLDGKNYLAAINRFKTVVTEHQTTAHVEEALMRLVECYMALGIKQEAQTAAAVLGHNFPNSRWYKDAYALLQSDGLAPREEGGSWLSKAWQNIKLPKLTSSG